MRWRALKSGSCCRFFRIHTSSGLSWHQSQCNAFSHHVSAAAPDLHFFFHFAALHPENEHVTSRLLCQLPQTFRVCALSNQWLPETPLIKSVKPTVTEDLAHFWWSIRHFRFKRNAFRQVGSHNRWKNVSILSIQRGQMWKHLFLIA